MPNCVSLSSAFTCVVPVAHGVWKVVRADHSLQILHILDDAFQLTRTTHIAYLQEAQAWHLKHVKGEIMSFATELANCRFHSWFPRSLFAYNRKGLSEGGHLSQSSACNNKNVLNKTCTTL